MSLQEKIMVTNRLIIRIRVGLQGISCIDTDGTVCLRYGAFPSASSKKNFVGLIGISFRWLRKILKFFLRQPEL